MQLHATQVQKKLIDETLAAAPVKGKNLLEPMKTLAANEKLPFNILEAVELTVAEAEIHKTQGDLWQCLEGEITIMCGGELVNGEPRKNADGTTNENELFSQEIHGATEHHLTVGDWLWIPPGVPHTLRAPTKARLIIIKIPAA